MVMKMTRGNVEVYEVYDDRGEAIGRVILPVDRRVVGRDSGTVYLARERRERWALGSEPPAAAGLEPRRSA